MYHPCFDLMRALNFAEIIVVKMKLVKCSFIALVQSFILCQHFAGTGKVIVLPVLSLHIS